MSVPRAIVVMGVSGVGKSTLGRALAERLGYRFIEGDDIHPAENIAKMSRGVPLEDADRWPWLARVADELATAAAAGGGVVSCSALKRSYRDFIREHVGVTAIFVHPELSPLALRQRLQQRSGHFMPAALLESQLMTLERPDETTEPSYVIDADLPVDEQAELVASIIRQFVER